VEKTEPSTSEADKPKQEEQASGQKRGDAMFGELEEVCIILLLRLIIMADFKTTWKACHLSRPFIDW